MGLLIQGSNNPIVIQFDAVVDSIPVLIVTLWCDSYSHVGRPLKMWERADMTIQGDTAICPITEAETQAFPKGRIILEAKGLDDEGNTIFWDEYPVDVKFRRDRIIMLTQTGGG